MTTTLLLLLLSLPLLASTAPTLFLIGPTTLDIPALLLAHPLPFHVQPSQSVIAVNASEGDGLLILASQYPFNSTPFTSDDWNAILNKKVRVMIEVPGWLPETGHMKFAPAAYSHRVLVHSKVKLPPQTILMAHNSSFISTEPPWFDINASYLVYARVAGVQSAVFGLPPTDELNPFLFEHIAGKMLVSASRMSDPHTSRYAPSSQWHVVWESVLEFLFPDIRNISMPWFTDTAVHPSYTPTSKLPDNAESVAFDKCVSWVEHSGILLSGNGSCPAQFGPIDSTCVAEGVFSAIDPQGQQALNQNVRCDCNCEIAMLLAMAMNDVSRDILQFVFEYSIAQQGPRADPTNANYGLVLWGVSGPGWTSTYYGDDNARLILASASALAYDDMPAVASAVLRCLFGNLRTTGVDGFRPSSLTASDLQERGWEHYFDQKWRGKTRSQPHYQAELWAAFLMAYNRTGITLFRDRAMAGIRLQMSTGFSDWEWTEYITEEVVRMILPLSFAVRIGEDPGWLDDAVSYVASHITSHGGMAECLGADGKCSSCPPSSNDKYGTAEAPMIQVNTDTVTDQLYSNNFLLRNLHEAAAATGRVAYTDIEDGVAEYLVRIQADGDDASISGSWPRGFDFSLWEYYGSAADIGWGPWSVESGWTQPWIAGTFVMRSDNTNLWDLFSHVEFEDVVHVCGVFFGERAKDLCVV